MFVWNIIYKSLWLFSYMHASSCHFLIFLHGNLRWRLGHRNLIAQSFMILCFSYIIWDYWENIFLSGWNSTKVILRVEMWLSLYHLSVEGFHLSVVLFRRNIEILVVHILSTSQNACQTCSGTVGKLSRWID
jgi:hypothetical protein